MLIPCQELKKPVDCLNGAQWFTSLDLKLGYWQVDLDEESKALTAFTVGPLGFYQCANGMPFGLTNAPATFQRQMGVMFRGHALKMGHHLFR